MERLHNACKKSMTRSSGGMNLPELKRFAFKQGLIDDVNSPILRKDLTKLICKHMNQVGGGKPKYETVVANTLQKVVQTTDSQGKRHSYNDKPAVIAYHIDRHNRERVAEKMWYKNGKLYRAKGKPVIIRYNSKGKVTEKKFK